MPLLGLSTNSDEENVHIFLKLYVRVVTTIRLVEADPLTSFQFMPTGASSLLLRILLTSFSMYVIKKTTGRWMEQL